MTKDGYEIYAMHCANDKILVDIYNQKTEETIRIDETSQDVKKLYEVLKDFFENGKEFV